MNASPYNSRAVTQAQPHEAAGSIWFEIWGVVDPDFKKSIFPGNFTNKNSIFLWQISGNYDFLQVISKIFSIFQGKFFKHFDFLGNLKKFRFSKKCLKNFDFFQAISQKIDFSGKFTKNFDFSGNFTKLSIFQGKFPKNFQFLGNFIGYLQLFLGKLFYFFSKVTTFEHTSCT